MIKIFKTKIIEIKDETEDIKILKFSAPEGFEFKAGQYLSLSVFDEQGRKIRKPFSIVNSPNENKEIEFCAKLIPGGLASESIKKMSPGDEVELFGPAGKFIVDLEGKDKGKDLMFIASGVGVAPFVGMIKHLLINGFQRKIILLKSSRNEESTLYEKEFSELSKKYGNFKFYNIYSQPKEKTENKGYLQNFLEKYIPDKFKGNFYVCGLQDMINSVGDKLVDRGFSEEQVFYEKFD